jgi:Zn-dependent protease/CBS domain-containing protein
VKIAEVWGIPIAVHPSWLVVFALVAWSLAGGYLPIAYPGWDALTYWAVGAVTALLAFASVLVHELGHSRIALRNGLPIRSITLFVFGGVAQIGREPATPGAELRIAIAGPLTSFALAALFGGVRLLAGGVEIVAAPAFWLAQINATVALFNLLPGFPLDGGRVLRAIVWRWTGSLDRATRAAALTGRAVATGFIMLGVLMVLRGNVVGGIWIALIGWFLDNAARQSGAQVSTAALLRGVSVAQAMTRQCPRVPGGLSLERLVQDEVLGAGRRCFFVVDADRLRGVLTLGDVKAIPRDRWSLTPVEQVMTPVAKLRSVTPRDDLLVALRSMDEADVAQLPVMEDGELIGAVGREEVLRYIAARAELGV